MHKIDPKTGLRFLDWTDGSPAAQNLRALFGRLPLSLSLDRPCFQPLLLCFPPLVIANIDRKMEVSFRLTLDKIITRNEKEAGQVVLTFLLRGGSYYRGIFLGGHGRGSSTPFQPHLKEYQAKQH